MESSGETAEPTSRSWWFRMITPGVLLAGIGALLWGRVNSTTGEIFVGLGLLWVMLELSLGPTAKSRVCTTGIIVEIPLVRRMPRAQKVLAKIDAAVRASRSVSEQPGAPTGISSAQHNAEATSETAAAVRIAAAAQTNAS